MIARCRAIHTNNLLAIWIVSKQSIFIVGALWCIGSCSGTRNQRVIGSNPILNDSHTKQWFNHRSAIHVQQIHMTVFHYIAIQYRINVRYDNVNARALFHKEL